jgi:hypothetical protein
MVVNESIPVPILASKGYSIDKPVLKGNGQRERQRTSWTSYHAFVNLGCCLETILLNKSGNSDDAV